MADYSDIIERLEKAVGPSRELDAEVSIIAGDVIAREVQSGFAFFHAPILAGDTAFLSHCNGGFDDALKSLGGCRSVPAYTASLDAAISLTEKLLPGWVIDELSQNARHAGDPWGCRLAYYNGFDPSKNMAVKSGWNYGSPAIALLIALFRALQAQERE